jgi:mono/diheme cytochrome c family protein
MRNFILGIIVTMVLLGFCSAAYLLLGYMETNADAQPSRTEMRIAMSALDASMDKHAPRVSSPVPPSDENLISGMKVYTMSCAGCHGGLDKKPSPLQHNFYPPVPQLILNPIDDPDWHVYYAVRTGIRYTGMPAWKGLLTDEDMWKVTGFLTHIEKLPAPVREYWKNSFGTASQTPPAAGTEEHHH